MKEQWPAARLEREPDQAGLESMLQALLPGARMLRAQRLPGGCSNRNYRVDLRDREQPLLLRIYLRDPQAAPLEQAIAHRLEGLLPVPVVLARASSNPFTGHPYALTTWLEGETLGAALHSAGPDPRVGAELGRAVGAALAVLGGVTFPQPGLLDAALRVRFPIARGSAGFLDVLAMVESERMHERLGPALSRAYRTLVAREAPRLEVLRDQPPCLVHSDYDPGNILVRRVDGAWRVTGVLDWEFAHSGSALADLGHILRPPTGSMPGFPQGLAAGYTGAGGFLPGDWRALSRLLDLTAFAEFLGRPDAGPEVIRTARGAIEDTLATWA